MDRKRFLATDAARDFAATYAAQEEPAAFTQNLMAKKQASVEAIVS